MSKREEDRKEDMLSHSETEFENYDRFTAHVEYTENKYVGDSFLLCICTLVKKFGNVSMYMMHTHLYILYV